MRKIHRWATVLFGIFIFFITATGLASHVTALWRESPSTGAAAAAAAPPPGFVCPEGWRCRPPPPEGGMRSWVGFFHHLHSGETFGPVGTAIAIASGIALLFFSVSGLWMYLRMYADRRRRGRGEWFWK